MRKLALAFSAAALAVPAAPVLPVAAMGSMASIGGTALAQTYHGRTWRDSSGRLRCRRSNGTVGLIVGGAGGALIGRAIDGGRNRTVGTVLGAAGGALLGRHIERHSGSGYRCR